MDDVRILKGYSEAEQKELEEVKKCMNVSDLIHIITGFPADTECGFIWDKYDAAKTQDQFIIIQDIVDFYFDKAKFSEQKYYVQLIRNNDGSYLNRNTLSNFCMTSGCQPDSQFQTEFTKQEIKEIDPRYMAFAVPVEEVED